MYGWNWGMPMWGGCPNWGCSNNDNGCSWIWIIIIVFILLFLFRDNDYGNNHR